MTIEWDSLILVCNELKTVGPATENARSTPWERVLTIELILSAKRATDRMLLCGTPISCCLATACCFCTNASRIKVYSRTRLSIILLRLRNPLCILVITLFFSRYQTSLSLIMRSTTLHRQLVNAIGR